MQPACVCQPRCAIGPPQSVPSTVLPSGNYGRDSPDAPGNAGIRLTLYEVISNSAGSSWMFQNRVPHILAGDYTPLSAVNIFIKDLGIVVDSARQNTFPVPLTSTAHRRPFAPGRPMFGP